MEDGQYDNGLLPAVIPYQGVEMMYKSTVKKIAFHAPSCILHQPVDPLIRAGKTACLFHIRIDCNGGKILGTSVGWADAVYLIPYRYYKRYDDLELLKNCWPMMKKYGDYLMAHLGRHPHIFGTFSDNRFRSAVLQFPKALSLQGANGCSIRPPVSVWRERTF